MAKRPKHLRKKPAPRRIESRESKRPGNTMIGPPIIKRFASFLTDLQEGNITWKSTLPVVLFLLAMLGAIIFFYKAF
ncbi:MAG: hypothetical protein IPM23_17490 [Candidatus Melainabacteria bacterium]|nr:hypothetical protein [Candidatus Melainabacteria bacterium]